MTTLMYRDHPSDALPGLLPPADDAPSDLQTRAEQLLARGADAIARALSHDSARFLAHNVQEGGE